MTTVQTPTQTKTNPLVNLEAFGQSIWLDDIGRSLLTSGKLKHMIDEDGLSGVTSNPSIFEKAINESQDYDQAIQDLVKKGSTPEEVYQTLVVEDIQNAADLLRPVWDRTKGLDGFISLEVSPKNALDAQKTNTEARSLWKAVNRPNLLVKVPGTEQGLIAIQQLISEGINVNVTLLFGLERYRAVANAYIAGLETRAAKNLPIDKIGSVASFFLSRIDALVDPMLEQKGPAGKALQGKVAIASAKVAYEIYHELFESERFAQLKKLGANPQRLLWASTSTKNPAYSDVMYIEALIGPETVNTVPMETINAYRDHGNPAPRLEEGLQDAHQVLNQLASQGIDLAAVTQQLETEGIDKFVKPFTKLMDALIEKCKAKAQQ